MRLDGMTYEVIAVKFGISRQRVQQLLSPPKAIRDYVVAKAEGKCQCCGIWVGKSGQVHHYGDEVDTYQDTEKLELLCLSCHRKRHGEMNGQGSRLVEPTIDIRAFRKQLGLTQTQFAKMVGTSYAVISDWETGREMPNAKSKQKLITCYNRNRPKPLK